MALSPLPTGLAQTVPTDTELVGWLYHLERVRAQGGREPDTSELQVQLNAWVSAQVLLHGARLGAHLERPFLPYGAGVLTWRDALLRSGLLTDASLQQMAAQGVSVAPEGSRAIALALHNVPPAFPTVMPTDAAFEPQLQGFLAQAILGAPWPKDVLRPEQGVRIAQWMYGLLTEGEGVLHTALELPILWDSRPPRRLIEGLIDGGLLNGPAAYLVTRSGFSVDGLTYGRQMRLHRRLDSMSQRTALLELPELSDWLARLRGPDAERLTTAPYPWATVLETETVAGAVRAQWHDPLDVNELLSPLHPEQPQGPSCLEALYRSGALSLDVVVSLMDRGMDALRAQAAVPLLRTLQPVSTPNPLAGRFPWAALGRYGTDLLRWHDAEKAFVFPSGNDAFVRGMFDPPHTLPPADAATKALPERQSAVWDSLHPQWMSQVASTWQTWVAQERVPQNFAMHRIAWSRTIPMPGFLGHLNYEQPLATYVLEQPTVERLEQARALGASLETLIPSDRQITFALKTWGTQEPAMLAALQAGGYRFDVAGRETLESVLNSYLDLPERAERLARLPEVMHRMGMSWPQPELTGGPTPQMWPHATWNRLTDWLLKAVSQYPDAPTQAALWILLEQHALPGPDASAAHAVVRLNPHALAHVYAQAPAEATPALERSIALFRTYGADVASPDCHVLHVFLQDLQRWDGALCHMRTLLNAGIAPQMLATVEHLHHKEQHNLTRLAAETGKPEALQILLDAGIDTAPSGSAPLAPEMAELFRQHFVRRGALPDASDEGHRNRSRL